MNYNNNALFKNEGSTEEVTTAATIDRTIYVPAYEDRLSNNLIKSHTA